MNLLYDLPINQTGIIDGIHTNEAIKERLHSFGLIKGVEITPVRIRPWAVLVSTIV